MVIKHTVLILFDDDEFVTLPWDEQDDIPETKRFMAAFEQVVVPWGDDSYHAYQHCYILTAGVDGYVQVRDIDRDDDFVPDDERCTSYWDSVQCWHRDGHDGKHEHVGVTW